MEPENETKSFAPGETVMQIFLAHNGAPVVVRYNVIESTAESLSLVATGRAGGMSGKTITFTKDKGIPRTYRGNEANRMFADYLRCVERLPAAVMNADFSIRDLLSQVSALKKIADLWRATLKQCDAPKGASLHDRGTGTQDHPRRIVNS